MRQSAEKVKERLLDYGFVMRDPLFVVALLVLRRSRAMRTSFFGASEEEDCRRRPGE